MVLRSPKVSSAAAGDIVFTFTSPPPMLVVGGSFLTYCCWRNGYIMRLVTTNLFPPVIVHLTDTSSEFLICHLATNKAKIYGSL